MTKAAFLGPGNMGALVDRGLGGLNECKVIDVLRQKGGHDGKIAGKS